MDLLERYLAEIRRNLPARDADDIVAELRDLLMARAEEQEEKTGKVEWSALLRDFGHPLVIAARYRKQQWLIGPELYPFYLHFLKVIVTIVVAVTAGLALVKGALWAADAGPAIAGFLGNLWWGAASAIGSVTIAFALVERFGGTSLKHVGGWKPLELPELNAAQPSVYESVFEVTAGILILLWWLGVIPTPQFGGSFRLVAAPIWQTLFWPVAALMTLQLGFNLVRWLAPAVDGDPGRARRDQRGLRNRPRGNHLSRRKLDHRRPDYDGPGGDCQPSVGARPCLPHRHRRGPHRLGAQIRGRALAHGALAGWPAAAQRRLRPDRLA